MTPGASGAAADLRAIAFASDDGSAWGAAVSGGDRWCAVFSPAGAGDGGLVVTDEPDGGWRLADEDGALSLLAVPDEPPAVDGGGASAVDGGGAGGSLSSSVVDGDGASSSSPAGAGGGDSASAAPFVPGGGPELCRVTGTVDGREISWRGIRVRMAPRSAKEAAGSARLVAGWFADGSAVGLIAARPRRHDRPDHDGTSATLFDPERWLPVSEPRLSTTYDASETPARVNLELWIGEGDHEYPRRAAGEASGPPAAATAGGGAALQVIPLRCHSRGEEGVGIYVLATF